MAEKGGVLPGYAELEEERRSCGLTVTRFCELLEIPHSTWYRWAQASSSTKGPWPTPLQDAVEADAKTLASDWDGWGHRKLAELKRVGIGEIQPGDVSDSTMYRVLERNDLCLPPNYTGEVRRLAGVRKETFISPPKRRNRLWQADFSEFETTAVGTWNLGGVVDYWGKVCLACDVSVRKTTSDAIAFFETALREVENLLGVSWIEDLTDPDTGEIHKLRLVTDNGSCFKSAGFATWIEQQRHLIHIRTRKKSPWTNGVIERFFGSIKYERLYRVDIDNVQDLQRETVSYRIVYNVIRPHEGIGMARPIERYKQTPKPTRPNPKSVSFT